MARRISTLSQSRKKGCALKFIPCIEEWTKACETYAYDKQIYQHFDISHETFYAFLDRERIIIESGNHSAFIESYKKGRNKNREWALENLKKQALTERGAACAIFAAKTFGGLLEAKDVAMIKLKQQEHELRNKSFLSDLASKFNLNAQELEKFASTYFKPIDLDL